MAITNKDVEKLKEVFATKDDLIKFATKDDLNNLERRLEAKIEASENKVVTRLDRVMGELEKAREDRVFAKAKDDDQDRRLNVLEAKVGV